jgi:hypothetical protein
MPGYDARIIPGFIDENGKISDAWADIQAYCYIPETKFATEVIKELEGKLAASEQANRELSERLAKIEDTPVPPASAGTSGDAREYEDSPVLIQFKNGVISRRG